MTNQQRITTYYIHRKKDGIYNKKRKLLMKTRGRKEDKVRKKEQKDRGRLEKGRS